MKKTLALVLVLALLSGAGLVTAHSLLVRSSRAVELTERNVRGNPAGAAGLTIHLDVDNEDRRLRWETALPVGGEPETEFSLLNEEQRQITRRPGSYSVVHMGDFLNVGYHGDGGIDLDSMDSSRYEVLLPLFRWAADQTGTAESFVEVHSLEEFCPYYPLDVEVDLPGSENIFMERFEGDEPQVQILKELLEAFRFPVLPEHWVKLSAQRDREGKLTSVDVSDTAGSARIRSWSALTEEWGYFIPEARENRETGDGPLLDYSLTPGGWGVYRLPCTDRPLTKEDLECTFALAADECIRLFVADRSGSTLFLAASRGEQCVLHILDGATGREQAAYPIPWNGENDWLELTTGEDCVVLHQAGGRFHLFSRDESGRYVPRFDGVQEEREQIGGSGYATAAYDGERLALADRARLFPDDRSYPICSVRVKVYDAEGLLYACDLKNSLEQWVKEIDHRYRYGYCEFTYFDAIRLQWEGGGQK